MHWFAAVVVPAQADRSTVETYVGPVMEPWHEEVWDWWQVGGLWTGVWDEYDPNTDPRNQERCMVCGGSGRRHDADRFGPDWLAATGGCNGCQGKGTRTAWPTQWVAYDGDVVSVKAFVRNPLERPFALVTPGELFRIETYDPDAHDKFPRLSDEAWEAVLQEQLAVHLDDKLVVVDYHD